jgi:hypothetical protein
LKQLASLVMSLVFLLTLVGNTSFAQSTSFDEKIIYKAKEITDINLLYERAKNGVTDKKDDNFKEDVSIMGAVSENDEIRKFSTTQKLLEVEKNNETTESFKTVSFVVVSEKHDNGIIRPFGSKDEEQWDGAYGIRAYSTVYYTRSTNGNLYTYTLNSVSGGWDNIDSQYSLSGRHVRYGVSGNRAGGGVVLEHEDKYPTGNTFSYTATSAMSYPVESRVIMGLNSYITIKRGTSSTWELHHQNNLEYNW